MTNFNGVWSLTAQYQAKGNSKWSPSLGGDVGLFAR